MDIIYFCEKHNKNFIRGHGCDVCLEDGRKDFLLKKENDRKRILKMRWPLSKSEKENGVTFA